MKKGFTLVELLAVIAILAILVIIALPNVMGMFNDAKKNSFTTEIKEIYKLAQQTWISDSMFNTGEKVYSRCSDCTGKSLDLSGREELEYYIKIDKAGKVREFYATDGTYQYGYEGDLSITSIKDVKPVASLPSSDLLKITNLGPEIGDSGRQITVCYYTHALYQTDFPRTDISCNTKQTINQCLGLNTTAVYLYKTSESNPGEENIKSCYASLKQEIGPVSQDNYHTYNNRCSNNHDFYQRIGADEAPLPTTSGCYCNKQIYLSCLDGETEITVYDKKKKKKIKKKLKDITYDDLVLAWDFDACKYVYAKVFWIMKPNLSNSSIILKFDNGSILKVIGDHRIFDYDSNTFVSCKEAKKGIRTITSDGSIISLVSKETINEEVYAYNLITEKHINVFANDILTSQGSNNIYEIKDMKFNKENRERFKEEDLKNIDKDYVESLRLDEWIVDEKGSKEETLIDLNNYVEHLKNNKK